MRHPYPSQTRKNLTQIGREVQWSHPFHPAWSALVAMDRGSAMDRDLVALVAAAQVEALLVAVAALAVGNKAHSTGHAQ